MSLELAGAFLEYAKHPGVRRTTLTDLERRLRDIVDTCRRAWPDVEVPERAFMRRLAELLPEEGDLDDCFSRMHGPDLYLACGCVMEDPVALAAFDGTVLGQSVAVLQRMGLAASQIDEVIQVVRTKLLVTEGHGRSPLLASYAGRGALVGWVRTAARRTALSLRRNKDEQITAMDGSEELRSIPLSADAELEYLKRRYQADFNQAVEDAIAALDTEQARVLRLHYHDGLSVDRIGMMLGVHRATAARWVRAASDAVRNKTRHLLHARLGLNSREIDSLARLIQSQLQLHLSRLLPPS